eukprot:TRINITY_DN133_c0_g1_i16.p1 TRINITY_DN133_c0_g1~~TRINITY_DN133_c0_g1_i16.p1  ORF type:complete len:276 (-),score=24.48 TRINITY_DN133_c0_g1_i16:336-1163(-)
MTLIAVSICALALVLCSILRGIMLYLKTKDSRAWYKYLVSKFFVRASESFVMLGYMIYILVTVRTIRLIDCKRVYNVQVMHIEMARECYADDHRIAAIFGWAIFTMFSVGYPIYSYYLLRCRVQNDAGVKTSSLLRSGEFLLSDMKPEYYWFRGCEMVSTFAICVISVTVHSVPWRLFLNGSIVLGIYFLVVVYWPMNTTRGNFMTASISFVKVLQSVLLLSYYNSTRDVSFFYTLLVLLSILIIVTGFSLKRGNWLQTDKAEKQPKVMGDLSLE